MRAYILRRMALFVPTAFGVSVFIFLMLHVIPGDYATTLLLGGRDRALVATEEDFARVRNQLGLDKPLHMQYATWAGKLLRGDLGVSWINRQPVLERMLPRIAVSAQLGFMAVLIASIIAIPGGVIAAVRQDTFIDYVLRFVSMIFESMPNFWIGLLLIVGLLTIFDWIPPISYANLWEDPWDNLMILIFPRHGRGRAQFGGYAADDPFVGVGGAAGGLRAHRRGQGPVP